MGPIEIAIRLVAGLVLILTNGFFVAIEFALTRARQFAESEFIGEGTHSVALERAWEMTNDLEIYLTTCQVGITASSIAVGIIAEPALAAIFEPVFGGTVLSGVGAGAVIAFMVINLVHLTHGEQTPTYLGVERSRFVCRYGATPLYWFNRLILPIIRVGDWVAKGTLQLFGVEMTGAWLETGEEAIESRAELRNRLGSVLAAGDLSAERRGEVMNALQIGEELPEFHGIVYFPVLARHWEEVAAGDIDFQELAADPMTLAPEASVSDAIDQFQVENQELALVFEGGDVIGMVTVTDLLESITGEIQDPIDTNAG